MLFVCLLCFYLDKLWPLCGACSAGESTLPSSKVFPRLKELLGLEDHMAVLNFVVTKLISNFKVSPLCRMPSGGPELRLPVVISHPLPGTDLFS